MNQPSESLQEAERALVGSLLLNPAKLNEVDVTVNDFATLTHARIFEAIDAMCRQSMPIDAVTVAEYLESETGDKWLHYTGTLQANTATAENAAGYAQIIKREAKKRAAIAIARQLALDVKNDIDAVDAAIRELMQLGATRRNYECGVSDALNASIEQVEAAQARGGLVGITTGIADLDDVLSGLHETDLIVIGARPAMGKTALMLNMADRCNVSCGIISGEQPREQIGGRLISINGRVAAQKIRTAKLDPVDWQGVTETFKLLSNKKIRINDAPAPHINDVIRQARKWKYEHNIQALFIDYIQRIKGGEAEKKHERIEDVVMELKSLARELKIPVVALSQVNRSVDTRPNKRPYMSDLSDSSAIEKEADVVITLYRDEVYHNDSDHKGVAELSILKNRHGPVGTVRTTWIGEFMRFEDHTVRWGEGA